jgi:hypothetical protein
LLFFVIGKSDALELEQKPLQVMANDHYLHA